jgi:hypothetical protein
VWKCIRKTVNKQELNKEGSNWLRKASGVTYERL